MRLFRFSGTPNVNTSKSFNNYDIASVFQYFKSCVTKSRNPDSVLNSAMEKTVNE